jgi:alkanesulfonate monooxygenase SsuD/methylene tetrahydromethanopterin reductase-like flavin-dependent oxidoreductase (luciferase family)
MLTFRPTLAPPGRLARLGIVLDTRNPPPRLRELARMCDRAGVDALWIVEREDGWPRLEAWTALVVTGLEAARARLGALLEVTRRRAALVAHMTTTLDAAVDGRLEIGLRSRAGHPAGTSGSWPRLEEYAATVRAQSTGGAGPPISIEVADARAMEAAIRVADDVVLPAGPAASVNGVIAQARAACVAAGRDPGSLGIAVELPVSIGRTSAEAGARASAEPLFDEVGHPARVGLFGTLQQCQDRVIELAHLGVTDLRCVLPNTPDVHDVIAQLTAVVVGSLDVLDPSAPRSRPPDPPETWGGRPRDRS